MISVECILNKKKFAWSVPSSFEQMTFDQFREVARVVMTPELTEDQTRQWILFSFFPMNDREREEFMNELTNEGSDLHIMDLYHLTDFVLKNPAFSVDFWEQRPKYKWSLNRTNRILNRLTGPGVDFKNVSLLNYSVSDPLFIIYRENRVEQNLNVLLASIYFEKEFDRNNLEDRAEKYISKIPIDVRQMMLFNWIGGRNKLAQRYPGRFDKPAEEAPKEDRKSEYDPLFGWRMIMDLPNEKFGTVAEIEKVNINDAFFYFEMMDDKIKEHEEV
jgi:hypothetical protein